MIPGLVETAEEGFAASDIRQDVTLADAAVAGALAFQLRLEVPKTFLGRCRPVEDHPSDERENASLGAAVADSPSEVERPLEGLLGGREPTFPELELADHEQRSRDPGLVAELGEGRARLLADRKCLAHCPFGDGEGGVIRALEAPAQLQTPIAGAIARSIASSSTAFACAKSPHSCSASPRSGSCCRPGEARRRARGAWRRRASPLST